MNELQNEIDQAFRLLTALPVSGDGVEIMAGAKEHLRKAYRLVEEKGEKNG